MKQPQNCRSYRSPVARGDASRTDKYNIRTCCKSPRGNTRMADKVAIATGLFTSEDVGDSVKLLVQRLKSIVPRPVVTGAQAWSRRVRPRLSALCSISYVQRDKRASVQR